MLKTETHKKCTKCEKALPLSDFYFCSSNKDKHHNTCKNCASKNSKQWRANNKERMKSNIERWRANNKEKLRRIRKEWRINNIERDKQSKKRYRDRIIKIPERKLNQRISELICKSLKRGSKGGRHWETLVGYTINELKEHLEKQFRPGMSWNNYGMWHIDHKKPKTSFDFKSPDDDGFKQCWALGNLQPLWAKDNINKGVKIFNSVS